MNKPAAVIGIVIGLVVVVAFPPEVGLPLMAACMALAAIGAAVLIRKGE